MAENNDALRPQDVLSVGSRVSWGAVLAGAVVTLAIYLVLTMIGAAIGLTVDTNAPLETLAPTAMLWAVVAACLAMFAGGYVTTTLTAGETKSEALMNGVILWGAVVGIMLWLAASGVQAGFNAMLSVAYGGVRVDPNQPNWEAAAHRAGVPRETIENWKNAASDEETASQRMAERRRLGAMLTWGALFGTLLSMGAAIGGALMGAGPSARGFLWPVEMRRVQEREHVHV